MATQPGHAPVNSTRPGIALEQSNGSLQKSDFDGTSPSSAKTSLQARGQHLDDSTGDAISRHASSTHKAKQQSQEPTKSQLDAIRRRHMTNLEEVPIEMRPNVHKYLIRRPRALQVTYHGKQIEIGDGGVVDVDGIKSNQLSTQTTHTSASPSNSGESNAEERSTDTIETQRERLDLFIDLLWVGIISNISAHFFKQAFAEDSSTGIAILEFIILFLPAWSMWAALQMFLTAYFMDDYLQRIVVVWYLILGMTWGNNAPYVLDSSTDATTIISTYLVAIATLRLTELLYSIWLPWLRRSFFVRSLLTLPLAGIWVGAILTSSWTQFGLVIGAVVYERAIWVLESSRFWDKISGDAVRTGRDWKHTIKRFENFFIIVLGEGVFLLVRDSPLGRGYSIQLGRGVMALLVYYLLHWIYFNGDQSKRIVHPVYRTGAIKPLWFAIHIPLFMAMVLLSSGFLYLIDYTPEGVTNGVPADLNGPAPEEPSATHRTFDVAKTTSFAAIGVALFSQLVIALLYKPLDPPKTLLINNRYLRLAPRALSVPLFAGLWAYDFQTSTSVLGAMLSTVYIVFLWEWLAGLERGGGLIEPKPTAAAVDEESSRPKG